MTPRRTGDFAESFRNCLDGDLGESTGRALVPFGGRGTLGGDRGAWRSKAEFGRVEGVELAVSDAWLLRRAGTGSRDWEVDLGMLDPFGEVMVAVMDVTPPRSLRDLL